MKSHEFTILVVDDEESVLDSFRIIFESKYCLCFASSGKEAQDIVKKEAIDLAFLDLGLREESGFAVLQDLKALDSSFDVIMVTADTNAKSAVKAIKLGALDYITKPFNVDEIELVAERALKERQKTREIAYLKEERKWHQSEFNILGESPAITHVCDVIRKITNTNSTVLITGESGTGKELVARAIHQCSPRKDEPFIAINCGAIPDLLLESELFGHEAGSFTGAHDKKIGKFEFANSGTIFLDEIANMPDRLQAKLLRVIQEREIQRVGGNRVINVNARIVVATNADLQQHIEESRFREDLYHRLNVIRIHVPALRDRKEDIPILSQHFIAVFSQQFNTRVCGVSQEALDVLVDYAWPGNVRELANLMERLVLLIDGDTIEVRHIPVEVTMRREKHETGVDVAGPGVFSFKEERGGFERRMIIRTLQSVRFNQTRAAAVLNIHRNTLLAKLRQYNIDVHALKKDSYS